MSTDEQIAMLRASLQDCLVMLLDLYAESGAEVPYGHEDAFRMGEWFDADDLMKMNNAKATLAATMQPKDTP